ncbi:MAG: 16S rRNA (cytosine(967)-C(5))-methyltransferase RsmB [Deltaproteobacteria bacterium]|nr:16S rRNA (cytosine(967)-C(5))-methyltransferase RsmB [Deltaproteobacteria bacterium]
MADEARKTALFVLNTLDKQNKTLDAVLDEVRSIDPPFSRRDRVFIHALVYGVLRWRGRLDWIIKHLSRTRFSRIDPAVLNILRLGLFQIIYLSRVPDSAAVNTSVEMAKSLSAPWVVRYVNGLLRNAVRAHKNIPFPDKDKDPVAALAAAKSFPEWLIRRWLNRFGTEETLHLSDAMNTIPPITVRTNTLKVTRSELVTALGADAGKIETTRYSPDGISFSNPKHPIPDMEPFQNGWFQVQDEAAQLAVRLLNPGPGDTVLDACAGLGGKTGYIAQMMQNNGRLVAVDISEKKLRRLESEMKRLGITIVSTCVHDLNDPLSVNGAEMYDRVFLDAPCSGLGVLRRNPDAKWSMSENELARHAKRQKKFLDNLVHLVKPSGILVYTVCSTEPEETTAVIEFFLNKYPEFQIDKNPKGLPLHVCPSVHETGFLWTFPHLNNMDGFFSVGLERIP